MRRALAIIAALAVVPLLMAARPGTSLQLDTQLNGQNTRWIMPDGGRSGIFTIFDAGTLNYTGPCVAIASAKSATNPPTNPDGGPYRQNDGGFPPEVFQSFSPNVIRYVSLTGANVCVRPSTYSRTWDGGCNTLPWDENYGQPVLAGVANTLVPDPLATHICAVTDAGFIQLIVWTVQ